MDAFIRFLLRMAFGIRVILWGGRLVHGRNGLHFVCIWGSGVWCFWSGAYTRYRSLWSACGMAAGKNRKLLVRIYDRYKALKSPSLSAVEHGQCRNAFCNSGVNWKQCLPSNTNISSHCVIESLTIREICNFACSAALQAAVSAARRELAEEKRVAQERWNARRTT